MTARLRSNHNTPRGTCGARHVHAVAREDVEQAALLAVGRSFLSHLPSEWPHETRGGHSGKTDEKEHHERFNCFTQNVQVQSLRHLGAFHWLAR